MKVFRIDTAMGDYFTLTEEELNKQFTQEDIQEFKDNEDTFFYETRYTVKQLNRARKLHRDQEYREWFEDEYMMSPSVFDILIDLYGEAR